MNQGDTAQFLATGGAPSLSYQWLRNGVAVVTTATPSYTTPPTVAADNGATFSVIFSNASGRSKPGNDAILTVTAPEADERVRAVLSRPQHQRSRIRVRI
jgi:beta-galactosidase